MASREHEGITGRLLFPEILPPDTPSNSFLVFLEQERYSLAAMEMGQSLISKTRASLFESERAASLSMKGNNIIAASKRTWFTDNKHLHHDQRHIRRIITNSLFSDVKNGKGRLGLNPKGLTIPTRKALENWEQEAQQLYNEYRQMVAPFEEISNEALGEILNDLNEFLTENPQRLTDVSSFLRHPSFAPYRERVSVFIDAFAEVDKATRSDPDNLLNRAHSRWLESVLSLSSPGAVSSWLDQTEGERAQTIEFMMESMGLDIKGFTIYLRQIGLEKWPAAWKEAFEKQVNENGSDTLSGIRGSLERHHNDDNQAQNIFFLHFPDGRGKKPPKSPQKVGEEATAAEEVQKPEKLTYIMALLSRESRRAARGNAKGIKFLSDGDFERYLRKRVGRISNSKDEAVLRDVRAIIESIKVNPFQQGCAVKMNETVTLNSKPHHLYRFRANQPELSLERPAISRDLRFVYFVIQFEGRNVVVLEGIYPREEIGSKFRIK